MFPDASHRYGSTLTAVRVRTRNERSTMTTAISTRGIKNVHEVGLMTMLAKELYLTRRGPTLNVEQIEVHKPPLLS